MAGRAAWRMDMGEREKQVARQAEQAAWLQSQIAEKAATMKGTHHDAPILPNGTSVDRTTPSFDPWGRPGAGAPMPTVPPGGTNGQSPPLTQQVRAAPSVEPQLVVMHVARPLSLQQVADSALPPDAAANGEESVLGLLGSGVDAAPQQISKAHINVAGSSWIPIPVELDEHNAGNSVPAQLPGPVPTRQQKLGAGSSRNCVAAVRKPPSTTRTAVGAARNACAIKRQNATNAKPMRRASMPSDGDTSLGERLKQTEAENLLLRRQLETKQTLIQQQAKEIAKLRSGQQATVEQPTASAPPAEEPQRLVGSVFNSGNGRECCGSGAPGIASVTHTNTDVSVSAQMPAVVPARATGFGSGGDPFLSATKACVRNDSARCGFIEAENLLRICSQYRVQIPPEMVENAKRKGRIAYIKFIDQLRAVGPAVR